MLKYYASVVIYNFQKTQFLFVVHCRLDKACRMSLVPHVVHNPGMKLGSRVEHLGTNKM